MNETIKKPLFDDKWLIADGDLGKFLHDAMHIIDDSLSVIEGEITIAIPKLFQELLDNLRDRKIFDGKNITFMVPERNGNSEGLVVAASTKKNTDEGEKMLFQPCGPIAHSAYKSDVLDVTVVGDEKACERPSCRYKGNSYLYPIIDMDCQSGEPKKFGLIGIANLDKGYLSENYLDLLRNMGRALGRQFGRVVERQKAKTNLINANKRLEEKAREIAKALSKIETLLDEQCKQVSLQTFLFGTINHDFKHALTVITSQLDSIIANLDETQRKSLERVKISVHNTLDLIEMIDDMEKVDVHPVSIHRFFEEYHHDAKLLLSGKNGKNDVKLSWNLDAVEEVFFDSSHLRRVMNNLVTNAFKYSPDGGEIHIASRFADDRIPSVVEITVSDQGIGIDKEDLAENLFKTRWRSGSAQASTIDGTGIGLSFVKYIINKCGGEINVESRPGRTNEAGTPFVTSFILFLPVSTSEKIAKIERFKRRRRVLVIGEKGGDNLFVNRDLQYLIEDLESGLGAINCESQKDMTKAAAAISEYDIVVCIGAPEENEPIIQAKGTRPVVVCLDTDQASIHVISEEKKQSVPAESFPMVVSQLIKLD